MSRRRSSSQSDQEELASITALIRKLTIRKNELQNRISNTANLDLSSQSSIEFVDANSTVTEVVTPVPIQTATVVETEEPRPFLIGDRVFVLSNYKGRYGTVGIIKELSPKFAYIQSNRYSYRIQVQLKNLQHHNE